jgi:hypothetical protein
VSIIATIVGSIDRAITLFNSVEKAPKEVREFHVSTARLQGHPTTLQAKLEAIEFALLYEDNPEEIEDTLRSCKNLFHKHKTAFSNQGRLSGVLRTT